MSKQNLSDLYRSDPVKACQLALRRTVNVPWQDRLEAINQELEMYGTEAIRGEWQNGYWCDIVAVYCNAGDTYLLTVLHVRGETSWHEEGRFIVSSWGDWVEKNGERLGVQ
jgi:hypothetical protein